MFVSEILKEAEYKVSVTGTGRSKSFNVINVDTGDTVGRHRNRAMAQNQMKSLSPKALSPADKLKNIANQQGQNVDRSKGTRAADKYLDKKGIEKPDANPKADVDAKPDKLKTPKSGFLARTSSKLKAVGAAIGGRGAGLILFLFVGADQFFRDLQVFAKVYEKEGCVKGTPNVNKAQVRFADRLTSNIMATLTAIVATGVAMAMVKKILMVLRAGALFAGPVGWIGYLITWVGAEAAIYAVIKMLEAKWFHAALSDFLMKSTFTQRSLVDFCVTFRYITKDSSCYSKVPGFIRKESLEVDNFQEPIFETVTKSEIKTGIKDIIMNDPKMLALMKKAKRNKAKGIKAGAS